MIENEFTQKVETIDYMCKNMSKLPQFISGLNANIEHQVQLQMLTDIVPRLKQEMAGTSRLLGAEVYERLKAVLYLHSDNLAKHKELLKDEPEPLPSLNNQAEVDRDRVIKSQISSYSKV